MKTYKILSLAAMLFSMPLLTSCELMESLFGEDNPIENSPIPPTTVADNSLKLDPNTIVPQEEAE
ncbi:MAG: hypothetical protein J6O49_09055 [Bacteroidaceae bacterium]|nr:hypothetical protein [Bacteroidaceae bacterium]